MPPEPAAAVILNWHGADDTLACLRSLRDGGSALAAIVVDNGSTDDSVARIAEQLQAWGWPLQTLHVDEQPQVGLAAQLAADRDANEAAQPQAPRTWLLASAHNLGFAAGCNLGLRAAQALGLERVVFLNNDTLVQGRALDTLVQRLDDDARCFATLPLITVHGSQRLWNAGGEVWPIGLRRYHLAGQPLAQGQARGDRRCSFFTGCCLAVRTREMVARGGWSERFFFGEEDFELSLWMRERGLHALCVATAVVEHRVSASVTAASGRRVDARAFVHYLNRFIHMRLRWAGLAFGRWRWRLWLAAYLPYVLLLLLRSGTVRAARLPHFARALLGRAARSDGVSRDDFEALMAGRW